LQNKKDLAPGNTLPENFDSLEEFWGFWDTHSSADYEGFMEAVKVDFDSSWAGKDTVYAVGFGNKATVTSYGIRNPCVRHKVSGSECAVAKDVLRQVRTRAHQQGVSTETLINLWLRERLFAPA
jgi:hypothetical protein